MGYLIYTLNFKFKHVVYKTWVLFEQKKMKSMEISGILCKINYVACFKIAVNFLVD